MNHRYSMLIEWSDEDQTFVVSLPEFGPYANTHGDTYEEAAHMGRDCLDSLILAYEEEGRTLPEPVKYRERVAV
jgi:predicted RNase H-like HicB family nuclease